MPFWLSGYATQADYDAHDLTWDGDKEFGDELTAERAAVDWLSSQGPAASVEVIRIDGSEGTVIAVVTQSGIERA